MKERLLPENLNQSCLDCVSGYVGAQGVFCTQFSQIVGDDEAHECELYREG